MFQVRSGTAALTAVALVTVFVGNVQGQSLKGSPESVDRMYNFAVQAGFDFLSTPSSVSAAVSSGKLERLIPTSDYVLHDVEHPYVRDEVKLFVERLGAQYHETCKEPLMVTGATRPLDMKLANASDKSVHPTGIAVDLRKPTGGKCLDWLRKTLLSLEKTGVIEATEEHHPVHFHVAVFPAPYANYVAALANAAAPQSQSSSGPSDAAEVQIVSYLVRSGDSLWRIAARHDTTVTAIQELNKLRGNTIYPGQIILVPAQNSSK